MAFSSSAQITPRDILRLEAKLRVRLRPLAEHLNARWLKFCAERLSRRVIAVNRRDAASLRNHPQYGRLRGVKYYDMEYAFGEPYRKGPFAAGRGPKEDRLRKAVLAYNTCDDAAIVFWAYLNKVLRDDTNFIKLECKSAYVRPHIILFSPCVPAGAQRRFRHTYFVITFKYGIRFVLDLSGYQFGFTRVLYTLRRYQKEVLERRTPRVEDIEGLIKQNTEMALGDPKPVWKKMATELLDLSFEF